VPTLIGQPAFPLNNTGSLYSCCPAPFTPISPAISNDPINNFYPVGNPALVVQTINYTLGGGLENTCHDMDKEVHKVRLINGSSLPSFINFDY
jgi:hypothetical protein